MAPPYASSALFPMNVQLLIIKPSDSSLKIAPPP